MSLNEKGMTTVLLIIISAILLLLFGMSLIAFGRVQLEDFLGSTREIGVRKVCLSRRDTFCESNPGNVWRAAAYSYQGQNCGQFFSEEVYKCQQEKWSSQSKRESEQESKREKCRQRKEELWRTSAVDVDCSQQRNYNQDCGDITEKIYGFCDYLDYEEDFKLAPAGGSKLVPK